MSAANPCRAHGCSACCHDTEMPLSEADVARLAGLGHDAAAFSRVDADGWRRLRTRDEAGAPCHFLRADGLCGVYEARPEGCRVYPFVLDAGDEVARDADCPHRAEFARGSDVARGLRRLVGRLEREAAARAR